MSCIIEIGIIGYGKHAGKLISLIEKNPDAEIKYIFHPNKTLNNKRGTKDFSKLLSCDAIIIASPNQTHFEYIDKIIKKFHGYIFCEKPPVTKLTELEKLKELNQSEKERIFFNFNLRTGDLNKILEEQKKSQKIGTIIHISVTVTQGLAFKKEYKNSWRADGNNNLHNILDAYVIHFLDLMNLNFGSLLEINYFPSFVSKNGSSFDTAFLVLKYKNGVTVSILNSYASPLVNEISVLGTNGYITIRDNKITIFSPRDTFDDRGYFKSAPKISEQAYSIDQDVDNSLRNSINYFIKKIKMHDLIEIKYFNASIETCEMILKLKEKSTINF